MITNKRLYAGINAFILAPLFAATLLTPVFAMKEGSIPTPKSPYGYVIDTTPTYTWTTVSTATNYQLQLYQGTTLIYTKSYGSTFCSWSTCKRTPADVLALGNYKWRIRAKVSGDWKTWSAYKFFELVEPSQSFNSDFNGSMKGWIKKAGGTWLVSDTALYTDGVANKDTSIYRCTGDYSNFTYQATIRRAEGNLFNYMTIRMGNQVDPEKNLWYPGYYFGYSNNGTYSIWRMDSPDDIVSIVYGLTSADIKEGDWNILKIVADGDYFEFWINGTRQVYFNDATFTTGKVGFAVPQLSAPLERFEVDSARLLVDTTP